MKTAPRLKHYDRGRPAEQVCTLQALYLREPQPLACAFKLAFTEPLRGNMTFSLTGGEE